MRNTQFIVKEYKPFILNIILIIISLIISSTAILRLGITISNLLNQEIYEYIKIDLIGTIIIITIATYVRLYKSGQICDIMFVRLKRDILFKLLNSKDVFFDHNNKSYVTTIIFADLNNFINLTSLVFSVFIRNVFIFLGALFILILTNSYLFFITISFLVAIVIPIIFISRRVKSISELRKNTNMSLVIYFTEIIEFLTTIKLYKNQDYEKHNINEQLNAHYQISKKRTNLRAIFMSLLVGAIFGMMILVLYIGYLKFMQSQITAGELTSFIFYFISLSGSLTAISDFVSEYLKTTPSIDRISQLINDLDKYMLAAPEEIVNHNSNIPLLENYEIISKNAEYILSINNLSKVFDNNFTIKNFNLSLKHGDKIIIKGKSGIGKSSIIKLLLGIYEKDAGLIQIDGKEVNNLAEYRNYFSAVLQDYPSFTRSIRDNILFRQKKSDEEIYEILEIVNAKKFINRLGGLDFILDNKGEILSGGQTQRILLARCLLRKTPIIILDEATSALDIENEDKIYRNIISYVKNATIININHRIGKLDGFNRQIIITEKDGEIAIYEDLN